MRHFDIVLSLGWKSCWTIKVPVSSDSMVLIWRRSNIIETLNDYRYLRRFEISGDENTVILTCILDDIHLNITLRNIWNFTTDSYRIIKISFYFVDLDIFANNWQGNNLFHTNINLAGIFVFGSLVRIIKFHFRINLLYRQFVPFLIYGMKYTFPKIKLWNSLLL